MSDSKLFAESLLMLLSSGPQHLITSILQGKCDPENKEKMHDKAHTQNIPVKNPQAFALSPVEDESRKITNF